MNPESAHIHVRIFAVVVPAHPNAGLGSAADQRDRLGHDVHLSFDIARNADFGLQAELNSRCNHFELRIKDGIDREFVPQTDGDLEIKLAMEARRF